MDQIYAMLHEIRPECDFRSSRSFVSDGYLDSFDIAALVAMLDDAFGIEIDGMDILPENFETVEAIGTLVAKSGGKLGLSDDVEEPTGKPPIPAAQKSRDGAVYEPPCEARLVTDYLELTCKARPDRTALVDERQRLTFAQVRAASLRIAARLIQEGVFKKPVAVFMDKGANVLLSFFGAAYSGNFYTPIDTKMPAARAEKILRTLDPAVVITDEKHADALRTFSGGRKTLIFEELMRGEADEAAVLRQRGKILDTDVLYVLFTSGSTGDPKGVIISHRAVIDYTEWVVKTFAIDETHVFGNQAPFYFDNSILDIYCALKTGAELHIIPEAYFSFPAKLLRYMADEKINIIFWVPSALCLLANYNVLDKLHLNALKKVLFCGEVMPNKQLNAWRKEYPDALFANLYGPTEITDVCTYYIVDRTFRDNDPLPIGFPCENTDVLVLDEENRLIEANESGKTGELCIRGTCLSYGYYNDEERTRRAFVQNPLNTAYAEKIYRTGDLAHYNERGELMYDGRKDFQIKHGGHRIELGEIETAAASLEGVRTNCSLYDETAKEIVLFYAGSADEESLKGRLSALIPKYMLPQRLYRLESLPLNGNGKIDRVRLKRTYIEKSNQE